MKNIKKLFPILFIFVLICTNGCSLWHPYIDSETGEALSSAMPISLLKRTSIKSIVSADSNSFFLTNNGYVLATGSNAFGLLGKDAPDANSNAVEIDFPERIKLITATRSIALAVSESNTVYLWGDTDKIFCTTDKDGNVINNSSAENKGEDDFYYTFSLPSSDNIAKADIGLNHIILLTKKGEVYTFGINNGQLGYNLFDSEMGKCQAQPRKIIFTEKFTDIAAGNTVSYFLTESGKIVGASKNSNGEMGTISVSAPLTYLKSENKFTKIDALEYSVYVIDESGTAFVCGKNDLSVFGLGSTLTSVPILTQIPMENVVLTQVICCADKYVHFISKDGHLYSCGENTSNILATSSSDNILLSPTITQIGKIKRFFGYGPLFYYVDSNSNVFAYGNNSSKQAPDIDENGNSYIIPSRIYIKVK